MDFPHFWAEDSLGKGKSNMTLEGSFVRGNGKSVLWSCYGDTIAVLNSSISHAVVIYYLRMDFDLNIYLHLNSQLLH